MILLCVIGIITNKEKNGKKSKGPLVCLVVFCSLAVLFYGGLKIIDSVNVSTHNEENKDGNPFLLRMSAVESNFGVLEHKNPIESYTFSTFKIKARINIQNLKIKISFYSALTQETVLDEASVDLGNLENGESNSFIVPHESEQCLLITDYKITVTKGSTFFFDWFVMPK